MIQQGEGSAGARARRCRGEFSVDGTIIGTGFTSTSISNFRWCPTPDERETARCRRPSDRRPCAGVRGNLAHGFLINGNAVGEPTTDNVKDVVQTSTRTARSEASSPSARRLRCCSSPGWSGRRPAASRLVRESVQDTLTTTRTATSPRSSASSITISAHQPGRHHRQRFRNIDPLPTPQDRRIGRRNAPDDHRRRHQRQPDQRRSKPMRSVYFRGRASTPQLVTTQ